MIPRQQSTLQTGNKSNQEIWTQKLLAEHRAGNVREAILLVNAATDTAWFRALWDYPICFPTGRIRFWRPGAPAHSPTHASALVYLGYWTTHFIDVFGAFGRVVTAATGTGKAL